MGKTRSSRSRQCRRRACRDSRRRWPAPRPRRSRTPDRCAMSTIGAMSAHCPNRCTGMIAFVLDVIADATASASMLNVAGSMSTNTGPRAQPGDRAGGREERKRRRDDFVAGPIPSAIKAASRASVPDDTPMACGMRRNASSSRSRPSTSGPRMKCWVSQTRVIAASTSPRNGANCAVRSSNGTVRGQT